MFSAALRQPIRAGLLGCLLALALAPAAQADVTVSFTYTPSPHAGQQMSFTPAATSTAGTITAYIWNFGDGSASQTTPPTQTSVPYTYSRGGVYTVTLTAVDSTGDTNQTTQQVGVIAPPTAAFNPTSATVEAGSNVAFDGTPSSDPDGSITAYNWNFGDGTTSTASQPTHSFAEPGTYNVTLAVTDSHGESSSVTHQISVITPPPVQTLVESIIPAPILIKFGNPTVIGRALVDLKERLFCPGNGPVCRTTVTETKTGLARDRTGSARTAASQALTTRANGNAEIGLHLTPAQWKSLLKHHHLSVALTLVSTRGAEKVTSTLRFKLVRRA